MLCGITAQPPHRDIQKTALGATESVSWQHYAQTSDAVQSLKDEGYQIIGIEQTEQSTSLLEFHPDPTQKIALVFGHEVKGIEQTVIDQCDCCIEIPQHGTKHSVNISVAAGIVVWDVFAKMTS